MVPSMGNCMTPRWKHNPPIDQGASVEKWGNNPTLSSQGLDSGFISKGQIFSIEVHFLKGQNCEGHNNKFHQVSKLTIPYSECSLTILHQQTRCC